MKRMILILLSMALLTGCSVLAPDSYLSITPHQSSEVQTTNTDAVTADNYMTLKAAILHLVRTGQTEGVIRVTGYDGDLEEELQQAAFEVSTLDPLGAYAVDYMTHSCNLLVSYYEIRVSITFRRSAKDIAGIRSVSTQDHLEQILSTAIDTFDDRVAVRLHNYRDQAEDIPTFLGEYCAANPATVMEVPKITVSVYPESGSTRIVEINFLYTNNPQGLLAKQRAVANGIDAAAEYIRYRQEDYDKVQLLYAYLTQRFQYRKASTVTPLYDALCSGVADPVGLAQAWQLICDKAGVECLTVSGMKNGEAYTWNILRTGSYYRHLDLAQCVLDRSGLVLNSDGEMSAYYWNMEQYPACRPIPAAQPEEEPPAEEEEEETPAEEETPSEELPQEQTQEQQT